MSRCFVHLKKTRTGTIILHTYYIFFNDALRRIRYIASRHAIRQYLIAEHTYRISMLKHIYYVTLRSQCVRLLCYIMHALISQTALYDILLQHTMTSCPQAVAGHLPSYLDTQRLAAPHDHCPSSQSLAAPTRPRLRRQ